MHRHSTQTQPEHIILEAVKNGQLNEIKIEDDKPTQQVPIQQNEVEKEINFIRYTQQLKKDPTLQMMKRMENRKII